MFPDGRVGTRGDGAAYDDVACDGETIAIAAGWLATRARLEQLMTLRADAAEALHDVRVALGSPTS